MPRVAQFLPDESSVQSDSGLDLNIWQCSGCGLVQLSDDPVYYYKDVIRASGLSEEMRLYRGTQFRGFLERFALPGKKVIEIGCGRGEYLPCCGRRAPTRSVWSIQRRRSHPAGPRA